MQGGSGKAIFTNSSVVTINGPNNKFFNRSADLYSTATWSEGLLYSGGAATFTIKPGGLFDIIGDLTAPYSSYVNYLTCTNQGIRSEERRVGKECRSRWSPY